jgi:hypothetical protein
MCSTPRWSIEVYTERKVVLTGVGSLYPFHFLLRRRLFQLFTRPHHLHQQVGIVEGIRLADGVAVDLQLFERRGLAPCPKREEKAGRPTHEILRATQGVHKCRVRFIDKTRLVQRQVVDLDSTARKCQRSDLRTFEES